MNKLCEDCNKIVSIDTQPYFEDGFILCNECINNRIVEDRNDEFMNMIRM